MAVVNASAIMNATFLESTQVDTTFDDGEKLTIGIEDLESNALFSENDQLDAVFDDEKPFTAALGESYKVVTNDYNALINKPSIEDVVLVGNKTFPELGLNTMTMQEIDDILFGGN